METEKDTRIIEAVGNNSLSEIKDLIADGADLNAAGSDDDTALMHVVQNGQSDLIKALLDAGANVNAEDYSGSTALMIAVRGNNVEIAKMLLSPRTDVYAETNSGHTALILATFEKNAEMIALLKRFEKIQNQELMLEHEIMTTPLQVEVDTPLPPEVYADLKMAEAEREKDNFAAAKIMNFIRCYCEANNVSLPAEFYFHNAKKLFFAKIHRAAKESIVRYLKDARRNSKNYRAALQIFEALTDKKREHLGNYVPLIRATYIGDLTILKWLIAEGVDLNQKNNKGRTALIGATQLKNAEVVKILLDAGADVNAKNNDGETALMCAAWYGNAEVVKILLNAGADVNAKNDDGKTALDFPLSEVAHLLKQK